MGLGTKLKLAVFISGRGSNLQAIVDACNNTNFPAEISLVLSNRPDAKGLDIAKIESIPYEIVDHKNFETREKFEAEMQTRLQNYEIDLIVLAGFMRVLTPFFIDAWPQKIINIHPSLLPDYKGTNTHARVLADGKAETGCTVHYVVPDVDSGEIIAQSTVPVQPDDTPETLAARVLKEEHKLYPAAIKQIATQQV